MTKEIDTVPSDVMALSGEEHRRARAKLREFLLDEYVQEGSVGAEIGVAWGDYSQLILDHGVTRLHLIDKWKPNKGYVRSKHWRPENKQTSWEDVYGIVSQRFQEEIAAGRVIIHKMASRAAVDLIEDESLDFIYIDGDHSYGGAKGDLTRYYPKIKKGGILLGDDYIDEYQGRRIGGVKDAVDEFVEEYDVEPLLRSPVSLQYALRKK